jgi:hypothetical protein
MARITDASSAKGIVAGTQRTDATEGEVDERDASFTDAIDVRARLFSDAPLERAAAFSESLRSREPRRILGGRAQLPAIDRGRILREYYRAIERAQEILRAHPEASGAVGAFVSKVSIPNGARGALLEAVGWRAVEREDAGELGTDSFSESTLARLTRSSPRRLTLSDEAILEEVFGSGAAGPSWPLDLTEFMRHPDLLEGDRLLDQLRVYARGRERKRPGMMVSDWSAVIVRLPRTEEAMRVLGRLIEAFEQDPASVSIDGVPYDLYRPPVRRRSVYGPLTDEKCSRTVQEWRSAYGDYDRRAMTIDDEMILRLWLIGMQCYDVAQLFPINADSLFLRDMLHLMSRARELGVPVVLRAPTVGHTKVHEILERLPDDRESVDAVHRAAEAFGWDTQRVRFNGQRLCDLPRPPGLVSTRRIDPLSDDAARDDLEVSYEDFERMATPAVIADPKAADRIVDLLENAGIGPDERYVESVPVLLNPELSAALARRRNRTLLERAPLDPRDPARFEERFIPKERPLGGERFSAEELERAWLRRDRRCLSMHDDCLSMLTKMGDLHSVLRHWNTGEIFELYARACEVPLGDPHPLKGPVWTLLSPHIPFPHVHAKSIPSILRLARASGFPLERLRYVGSDGDNRSLADHPEFEGCIELEKRSARARRSLARSVRELERAASDPSVRASILVRLISGGDPPIETGALIGALLEARIAGRITGVSVDPSTYADLDHVGAIALIAGLAANADVQEILREKGYDEATAEQWASVARALSSLEGKALAYACADVAKTPPDFTSLPVRVLLASVNDAALSVRERDQLASQRPLAFVAAVLERAIEARASPTQGDWLELIDGAVKAGVLDPELIAQAVESFGPVQLDGDWMLAAALLEPIEPDLMDEQSWKPAFDRLARYVGADRAAAHVLRLQYVEDLHRVIPLGDVDGDRDALEPALDRLRELAGLRTSPAEVADRRAWQWVEVSLIRALEDGLVPDDEAVLGVAEAFHAGLLSRKTLEAVRDLLPSARVEELAAKTRASDARAVLTCRVLGGGIGRTRFHASVERVVVAKISRGVSAPDRSPSED